MINTTTATTAALLAFFNANTGGAQVKKFADRKTAERRVTLLLEEMADESSQLTHSKNIASVEIEDFNSTLPDLDKMYAEAYVEQAPLAPIDAISLPSGFGVHGQQCCPACGIDLNNGVGEHTQEVNGKFIKHAQFQYECLGCGHEFGPAITNHYVRPSGAPITSRPAMAASLKLDRQILSVNSGIVYKNACQVWKSGLVSSSQCDRLSAVLYGAAKAGNRLMSVTINGHIFALAVK